MLFATLLGDVAVNASAQVPVVIAFDNTDNSGGGTVYSGVKFDNDGSIYRRPKHGGTWQLIGTWLLVGANTAFHIHRVVDSGSLTTDGGDNQVLSSDRIYDVQQSTPGGNKAAAVSFRISNVADNITYETRQYSFDAILENP